MKNLAENNLVRFLSIVRKKDGLYAKFKVCGIREGTTINTSVLLSIDAAGMDPTKSLEEIIEACGKRAAKDCHIEAQFEGLHAL